MKYILEFLSTLKYHDHLNPTLWNGDNLKSDVRQHLLSIAYMWAKFADIDQGQIKDIIMSGGNCNYNYTDESDIDVHIIYNPKTIFSGVQNNNLIKQYMLSKKGLWAVKHQIKVYGYPIEVFAQPDDEPVPSNQGSYSLISQKWILHPSDLHLNFDSDKSLEDKVAQYEKQIHSVVASKDYEAATDLYRSIQKSRAQALYNGGEFALDNLTFKELRNRGLLQRLKQWLDSYDDQRLSLSSPSAQ